MKRMEPGINWIWYTADNEKEAEEYYEEIKGCKPKYDWEISKLDDGRFGFRIHR